MLEGVGNWIISGLFTGKQLHLAATHKDGSRRVTARDWETLAAKMAAADEAKEVK